MAIRCTARYGCRAAAEVEGILNKVSAVFALPQIIAQTLGYELVTACGV
jgi:hypothetical protein